MPCRASKVGVLILDVIVFLLLAFAYDKTGKGKASLMPDAGEITLLCQIVSGYYGFRIA